MDVRAYIESGILELYTLQLLSDAERREVEALAAQYPEIAQELQRIEQATTAYALAHERAPRPELKDAILSKIPAALSNPVAAPSKFGVVQAVLVAALVLATLAAGFFYTRQANAQQQLAQLSAEKQQLEEDCALTRGQLERLTNPITKVVVMNGLPIAPDARVRVYWNPADQTTLLSIENLPAPPSGMQYQLWAIAGSASPVSAGVFDAVAGELQTMLSVADADTFAVTLEPAGGSPTPTLERMYVVGKI